MKYIQLAPRLRIQRGAGKADLVSERPHKRDKHGNVAFSDDPEKKPTLVEFDEHCQVDIPALLRIGAIREQPVKEVKRRG